MANSCAYPMSKFLCYDSLTPNYDSCLATHNIEVEPRHYNETIWDARWVLSMQQEL